MLGKNWKDKPPGGLALVTWGKHEGSIDSACGRVTRSGGLFAQIILSSESSLATWV